MPSLTLQTRWTLLCVVLTLATLFGLSHINLSPVFLGQESLQNSDTATHPFASEYSIQATLNNETTQTPLLILNKPITPQVKTLVSQILGSSAQAQAPPKSLIFTLSPQPADLSAALKFSLDSKKLVNARAEKDTVILSLESLLSETSGYTASDLGSDYGLRSSQAGAFFSTTALPFYSTTQSQNTRNLSLKTGSKFLNSDWLKLQSIAPIAQLKSSSFVGSESFRGSILHDFAETQGAALSALTRLKYDSLELTPVALSNPHGANAAIDDPFVSLGAWQASEHSRLFLGLVNRSVITSQSILSASLPLHAQQDSALSPVVSSESYVMANHTFTTAQRAFAVLS